MEAPVLIKPIPLQVVNEGAAYGPFDLKQFIQSPDNSKNNFTAELSDGGALPQGMICTEDGLLTGIPSKGTKGNYEVIITIGNEAGSLETSMILTIKPSLLTTGNEYADQLKSQVWEALDQNLPIPDLSALYDRPVTIFDVYYLLERWAMLTVWDAFNLEPAGEKVLLNLEGASKHYNVYDRGSCLVASPKDLFSHERTLIDALQTAKAIAREVYKRSWTIEMAGFEKMVRAVWVEMQLLGDKYGKRLEILHFDPGLKEIRIYNEEAKEIGGPKMEIDRL